MERIKFSKEYYFRKAESQAWLCVVCLQNLEHGEFSYFGWGLHHLKKKSQGGSDEDSNLVACHNYCNSRIEDKPVFAKKLGLVL
jgi:hypothetical protein